MCNLKRSYLFLACCFLCNSMVMATSDDFSKAKSEKERIESAYLHGAKEVPQQTQLKPRLTRETIDQAVDNWSNSFYEGKKLSAQDIRVLDYQASNEQLKAFNEKYKYDLKKIPSISEELAHIKLNAKLLKDKKGNLAIFTNPKDEAKVKQFLHFQPTLNKVFSNYLRRVMSLQDGNVHESNLGEALYSELTFDFGSMEIPSSHNLDLAHDQYSYILNRLEETDEARFWNWVNYLRGLEENDSETSKNTLSVPPWVRLIDALFGA